MKVVFHPLFYSVYENDPAAQAGRMEAIIDALKGFEIVEPEPAEFYDINLCHTPYHISSINRDKSLYDIALLSAGGSIKAAELAMDGEPAFALIRPPGHHASQDSCWGFCFFNNIAISVSRLLEEDEIKTALILDFDMHYGDGTANIFSGNPAITYFHPEDGQRQGFVNHIDAFLSEVTADIIAVSAGFDRHVDDWGKLLITEDYRTIGKLVRQFALEKCGGKRFAVLEGGYNHEVLGRNVLAFLEGME